MIATKALCWRMIEDMWHARVSTTAFVRIRYDPISWGKVVLELLTPDGWRILHTVLRQDAPTADTLIVRMQDYAEQLYGRYEP